MHSCKGGTHLSLVSCMGSLSLYRNVLYSSKTGMVKLQYSKKGFDMVRL